MPSDEPHVKVTLTTIYEEQQGQGKILVEIKETLEKVVEQGSDHEHRIRLLERKIYTAAGWAAALAALGGTGLGVGIQQLIS